MIIIIIIIINLLLLDNIYHIESVLEHVELTNIINFSTDLTNRFLSLIFSRLINVLGIFVDEPLPILKILKESNTYIFNEIN